MPPNRAQLEQALIAADKAGNIEDAKQLAKALRGYKEPVTPSEPDGFSFARMAGNIPGSAAQFGKDMVYPFLHPVDTAKSLGKLALGGVAKVANAVDEDSKLLDEYEPYADQMGQFMSDRYGSWDAAKRTIENDPVGAIGDLATVMTGGGAASTRIPGMVGRIGRAVNKAGRAVDPVNVAITGLRGTAKGLSKMVNDNAMYQKSAKFSTTMKQADRAKLAETALDKGIMPTQKGVDKLQGMMDALDGEITGLINDATQSGKVIPKDAIYRHMGKLRRKMGGPLIEGGKSLNQIDDVARRYKKHMKAIGKDYLTPDELQAFKRDAYRHADFELKQGRAELATNAARREMSRAAKESIEEVAPVKDLNKKYGELIELMDPLQRSSNRIENRNLVSLETPLHILAGSSMGPGGAVAGTMLSVLEHPKPRAWVALKVRKMKQMGVADSVIQKQLPTLIRQAAVQFGRTGQELGEPVEQFDNQYVNKPADRSIN